VLIMHRLHEDDLAGHVLEQEPWEVLRLPAIADDDELHWFEGVFGHQSFGRQAGEALHPARERPKCSSRSAAPWANNRPDTSFRGSPASTSRCPHPRAAA
jgi:hypothetical protein